MRLLLGLILALATLSAQAQQALQATTFTATSATSGNTLDERKIGITFHKIVFTVTGTVSACVLKVDSSLDGITFNDGDVIGGTTCTSAGASSVVLFTTAAFLRVRTSTAVTGTGSMTVTYLGFSTLPAGGTGTVASQVQGTAATGSAAVGNPVQVAGLNGGNMKPFTLDSGGNIALSSGANGMANGVSNSMSTPLTSGGATLYFPSVNMAYNNSTWDRVTTLNAVQPTGAPPVGALATGGPFISYSPTQLGVNALTLPASSTSALSNTIDTRGAKQVVLTSNCGQIYHILVSHYQEDGTTVGNTIQIVTSQVASAQCQLGINAEGTNWGTCTGSSGSPKMPQRAISFSFMNTTATPSTCTARLFVQY